MKDYIEIRVKDVANYIINTGETIRQASKVFKVSKSTIHKDINERLVIIAPQLLDSLALILQTHKDIRHIHGGESTRNKYKWIKTLRGI